MFSLSERRREIVVILNLTRVNRYTGELEVLLQKRADGGRFGGRWTPACVGHYDDLDHSLEKAMVREAREELGLRLNQSNLRMMLVRIMPGERDKQAMWVFYNLNKPLLQEPVLCEPQNCKKLRWVPFEDAMELIWQQDPFLTGLLKAIVRGKLFMDMRRALKERLTVLKRTSR